MFSFPSSSFESLAELLPLFQCSFFTSVSVAYLPLCLLRMMLAFHWMRVSFPAFVAFAVVVPFKRINEFSISYACFMLLRILQSFADLPSMFKEKFASFWGWHEFKSSMKLKLGAGKVIRNPMPSPSAWRQVFSVFHHSLCLKGF